MLHRRNMASKEFLILLAIVQFYLGISGAPSPAEEKPEICDTVECKQLADAFSKSMNESADPCVDFYEFTCGNYKNSIYEDRYYEIESLAYDHLRGELESPSTLEDILPVQQAKQFYQSCVDNNTREANGLERLNSILQSTNGWPMIMSNGTWNDNMPWQEIEKYYSDFLGHAFYKAKLDCTRTEGANTPFLQITHSPTPSTLYSMSFKNRTQEILYRSIIKRIAQILIEENGTSVSDEELEKDVDDLITFEDRLRTRNNADSLEADRLYSNSNDTDILKLNGFIGWWNSQTKFIATTPKAKIDWYNELQREFASANISINGNTGIEFKRFGYFIELITTLKSTDARTIINYIQWKFVISSANFFNEKISSPIYDMLQKKLGISEKQPRCDEYIKSMKMRRANMYIFIRKYYSNSTKEALHEIVSHLKESLELQITNSIFSNETVEAMKRRLNRMKFFLGDPDWLRNETALINYYEGLTIGSDYFENVLNYKKYEKKVALRNCVGSIETEKWWTYSLHPRADYNFESNSIRLSPTQLQSPLLGIGVPNYINYGIAGFAIGHEMGHAYGYIAMIEGGAGPNETISEDRDQDIYLEHARNFSNIFNEFYRTNNITLNLSGETREVTLGDLTFEENLADWIGIRTALNAYREMRKKKLPKGESKLPGFLKYNDEKMFFISYAQRWCENSKTTSVSTASDDFATHSPTYLRINGPLFNDPAFADTFECNRGTPMNPEEKLIFWNSPNGQPPSN